MGRDTKVQYIGLDFEASGSDTDKCAPTQIGLAVGDESFSAFFNWRQYAADYEWQEEAFRVHGVSQSELDESGDPAFVVDAKAVAWLWSRVEVQRMNRLAVGWNVAGYDRRFVDLHLPYLRRVLSYRTVDLNALCFGLDGKGGVSWKDWKREAKTYANKFIDPSKRHDAEVDAQAALREVEFLRGRINDG